MRLFFTLLTLFTAYTSFGQVCGVNIPDNKPKTDTGQRIRIRCGQSLNYTQPLIVVDGIPIDQLNSLTPNDIEQIDVLKGSTASAIFGRKAENGVILITTKAAGLTIIDKVDGVEIPGATVTIIPDKNRSDSARYVSDEDGRVSNKKLRPGQSYYIRVSSAGYDDVYTMINAGSVNTIELDRKFLKLSEVVVEANGIHHIAYNKRSCLTKSVDDNTKIPGFDKEKGTDQSSGQQLKVYPNPVTRGNNLTISIRSIEDDKLSIRILSSAGNLIRVIHPPVNDGGTIQLPVNNNWSAGIYFIQITSEKGQLLKTEKVVIN